MSLQTSFIFSFFRKGGVAVAVMALREGSVVVMWLHRQELGSIGGSGRIITINVVASGDP